MAVKAVKYFHPFGRLEHFLETTHPDEVSRGVLLHPGYYAIDRKDRPLVKLEEALVELILVHLHPGVGTVASGAGKRRWKGQSGPCFAGRPGRQGGQEQIRRRLLGRLEVDFLVFQAFCQRQILRVQIFILFMLFPEFPEKPFILALADNENKNAASFRKSPPAELLRRHRGILPVLLA